MARLVVSTYVTETGLLSSAGTQQNKQYTPKRGSAGGYHPYSR